MPFDEKIRFQKLAVDIVSPWYNEHLLVSLIHIWNVTSELLIDAFQFVAERVDKTQRAADLLPKSLSTFEAQLSRPSITYRPAFQD
jgi:hypothetical protein